MEWWKREKNAIADGKKIAKKSAVSQCEVLRSTEKNLALLDRRPPAHLHRYTYCRVETRQIYVEHNQ